MAAVVPSFVNGASYNQWREFFARGEEFAVVTDHARAARARRNNVITISALSLVLIGSIPVAFIVATTAIGSVLTFLLLTILALLVLITIVRFAAIFRRLSAVLACDDEYVRIHAGGIRYAGTWDIAWSEISGVLGFDARMEQQAMRRPGQRIIKASGYSQAELWLGLPARSWKQKHQGTAGKAFEIVGENGGLRLVLNNAVDESVVQAVLAAVYVAATEAGVDTLMTLDQQSLGRGVQNLLLGKGPRALRAG